LSGLYCSFDFIIICRSRWVREKSEIPEIILGTVDGLMFCFGWNKNYIPTFIGNSLPSITSMASPYIAIKTDSLF